MVISGFIDEATGNFEDQIKYAKELGLTHVCIRTINGKGIATYTCETFKNDLAPILTKYNMKVSSIGSSIGKIKLDDAKKFDQQKTQLEELCKIANLIDCKYIRMFSFFLNGDKDSRANDVISKLKEFVEIAKKYNVILLHENEKGIFGDSPQRCKLIYEKINSDNLKLIHDASNYEQCGYDALEAFHLLKDYDVYYHIKDCDVNKLETTVGTGIGKCKEILKELSDSDYQGFLTLEPHIGWMVVPTFCLAFTSLIPSLKGKKMYQTKKAFIAKEGKEVVTRKGLWTYNYNALKAILKDIK